MVCSGRSLSNLQNREEAIIWLSTEVGSRAVRTPQNFKHGNCYGRRIITEWMLCMEVERTGIQAGRYVRMRCFERHQEDGYGLRGDGWAEVKMRNLKQTTISELNLNTQVKASNKVLTSKELWNFSHPSDIHKAFTGDVRRVNKQLLSFLSP